MLRRILVFTIFLTMFSCSSTSNIGINNESNKSDVALYKKGMKYLKAKDFENAVEVFTELEIVHPYSSLSSKSQLFAFSHYLAKNIRNRLVCWFPLGVKININS